jgi:hypothetical protein
MRGKLPKVRLIDDTDFLFPREIPHEHKPDFWLRSDDHLAWVRSHKCRYCPQQPGPFLIQACHLRKGTNGAGSEKPSDFWTWPGCPRCHAAQGLMGEIAFHRDRGTPDPWRMVLEEFGMLSPYPLVAAAAKVEWERRYAA